jgi:hypothetical protein
MDAMTFRQLTMGAVTLGMVVTAAASSLNGQAAETFAATASVKGAGGSAASAPVTVTVDRKMSKAEADKFAEAFRSGGAAGLRKALEGVKPTGSVTLGKGKPVPARLAIERPVEKGRLLTIVTDTPLLFLGASLPYAKAKSGYHFGVVDLEVDAAGSGTGTLAPAAKITVKGGAFVVEDYGSELVRLTAVKPVK